MHYFAYDGTSNGFFTAVFDAYAFSNTKIVCEAIQLSLTDEITNVKTDGEKAARVLRKIRKCDRRAEFETDKILHSDFLNRSDIAYRYIRALLKHGAPVREQLTNADVFNAMEVVRKVEKETERFRGFLRFMETKNGVLYAPCSPDNDITEYLLPHFISRFSNIPFVIHDIKREKAGFYDKKNAFTASLNKSDIYLSDGEQDFCALWKEYYAAVNIPERKRLNQMKGYMPVRYWKFLHEKQP